MLCLQNVSDPVTLQSVEAAVRGNTSLKKMTITHVHTIELQMLPWTNVSEPLMLTWNNVAVAILKGAAKNKTLGTLELAILDEPFPAPELVDEVRRSNPKLQLTVWTGWRESEHVTVVMTVV